MSFVARNACSSRLSSNLAAGWDRLMKAPFPRCFRTFSRLKAYTTFIESAEILASLNLVSRQIKDIGPHFAYASLNNFQTYFLKHACRSRQRCSFAGVEGGQRRTPRPQSAAERIPDRQPPVSRVNFPIESPRASTECEERPESDARSW